MVHRKGERPATRGHEARLLAAAGRGHFCRISGFRITLIGDGALEGKRVRYNGQGFSLKGEKDRFVLPPDFRKALKESGADAAGHARKELCLQLHPDFPCLVAFGLGREAELDAQLDKEEENALRRGAAFNRQVRSSQLFGFLKVPFDDSGRFVLPPRFVKGAQIDDQLYFQGAGPEFLIFNPVELARLDPADWRHAQLACEDLTQQALAKAKK